MSGIRALVLGVTGINKTEDTTDNVKGVLARLGAWVHKHYKRQISVVDFDRDYVFNDAKGDSTFLDCDDYNQQRDIWWRAWRAFCAEVLEKDTDTDLYVSMHGCFVGNQFGVRYFLDPNEVVDKLQPNLVIHLIDDIYDMWWRTEDRSSAIPELAQPTMEQLLFARRIEGIISDQVSYCGTSRTAERSTKPIRKFTISVSHPCETLAHWIYSPSPRVVYLCFPITAPRELKAGGDPVGINDVNGFLRIAYERQKANQNLVVVCPLGIDELPLREEFENAPANAEDFTFDREMHRWPMDFVWPPESCLSPGPPSKKQQKPIPLHVVKDVYGMIYADVSWRDYSLVGQAHVLASFNPVFRRLNKPSKFSGGVKQEILAASTSRTHVHVYQDDAYDSKHLFEDWLRTGSTMVRSSTFRMIHIHKSVEDVFKAVESTR